MIKKQALRDGQKAKSRKLTEKEKMFVREFLIDLNATQAAIRAGFSERSARQIGSNLLAKVYIRDAIKAAIKKRADKVELTADYVLDHLMELVARCMQEKPVMVFDYKSRQLVQQVDEEGKGVWMFDSAGANKALRSLGEHLALFKKVLAGDKDNPIVFEPITIIKPKINERKPLSKNGVHKKGSAKSKKPSFEPQNTKG